MNRLEEINQRLAEIKELVNSENANIDDLTTETDALIEERKSIMDDVEKRQTLS